jgi:hypothetical protein
MPSYFSYFPQIYYDAVGDGNFKIVTNILRRVKVKQGLKEVGAFFDEYDVDSEMTPEIVSEQVYGNQKYYWIILLFNEIKDRYYDWPLTASQFETYVNDKYDDINGIHHYEITQESGSTTSIDDSHKIQVNSTVSGATAVTNYEYEERLQNKKRRIRLLKPEFLELFVEEFKTLAG